jgi:hypothetical protein
MFEFFLIAQLNMAPATKPQLLEPIVLPPQTTDLQSQQRARTEYLRKQQQLLNQTQQDYQQDKIRLERNSLPSRLDCSPLFPPTAAYPTGTSAIDCSRP